jgi:hypothetical protein
MGRLTDSGGAASPQTSTRPLDQRGAGADVAFIGGAGRSGSTVLALLMGRIPGLFPVGGLGNLWERGLRENYLCGCGTAFRDCGFWQEVGREAFGGWETVDADEVGRLKLEVERYRYWPWHVAPALRPGFAGKVAAYGEYLEPLYAAVKQVSGCEVIVDNSHNVLSALVLSRMPNIRLSVLHLVRDSRGVAFSLSKRVLRSEAAGQTYMTRYSASHAGFEWLIANLPYHAIGRRFPRLRVSYEAVAASPATELARIAAFLGATLPPSDVAELGSGSFAIAENHMISGNPHRVGRDEMRVRLDDEWRRKMKPADRLIVTLLTFPLALTYGYVGHRRQSGLGGADEAPSL